MRFIEIIKKKKFILISIFLFLYIMFNLLDGERGLISYFEKIKLNDRLIQEERSLIVHLDSIEQKNDLLTDNIDLDYLEILYRKKFMIGKQDETIYKNK